MPDYEKAARKAAKKYGVDPDIFVAQLRQESGLKPGLTSPAGASGIAQFMPGTAKSYGVNLSDGKVGDDLDGAARYMRDGLKQFGGDYEKALAAYNAGAGAVQKYGGVPPYKETQHYVSTILANAGKGSAPKLKRTAAPKAPAAVPAQTTTTPGVDNSGLRRELVGQFLSQGGVANPNAVLTLAGSYGQAADTPGTTSTVPSPQASTSTPTLRSPAKGQSGSKVLELIYNDGGKGYGIKDGQTVNGSGVFSAVWAGHANHVHVAAGPKTTVRLGKLAQDMGLHVGENPSFGGVDAGAHVEGSYHNKSEAIDVSGDPKKMAAFAKRVAAYNRTRKL